MRKPFRYTVRVMTVRNRTSSAPAMPPPKNYVTPAGYARLKEELTRLLDNLKERFGRYLDVDGDGIPDVLEDADGDGLFDNDGSESDWTTSTNGTTGSPGLLLFTPLE